MTAQAQRQEGFRKPKPADCKPVRVAVITTTGNNASSSCGWEFFHTREKVREDAIDRHLEKRHGGMGIRL